MKHNYIILIALISFAFSQAQIVNIPDANFKNALVNTLCVDTNDDGMFDADADSDNDGEIQESEAESVIKLDVSNNNISSLSGIEAFINLESIELSINQVSSLDFSSNLNLDYLSAGTNQLSSVNISNNSSLTQLFIGNNQMTQLDVSNNSQLTDLCIFTNQINTLTLPVSLNNLTLFEFGSNPLDFADLSLFSNVASFWCDSTEMTSLDLSLFTNLEVLVCLDNEITFLDVRNGNNANISLFDATLNASLECIFVDDANGAYLADWDKDNESTFVNNDTECQALSVEESELQNTINIYPNPVRDVLHIESQKRLKSISVYDVNGRRILKSRIQGNVISKTINLSTLSSGLYVLKLNTEAGEETIKIIKE